MVHYNIFTPEDNKGVAQSTYIYINVFMHLTGCEVLMTFLLPFPTLGFAKVLLQTSHDS